MIFECRPSSIVKGMRTNEIWKFPGNYVLRWKIGQQRVTRIQSAKSSGWVNFRALQEYVPGMSLLQPGNWGKWPRLGEKRSVDREERKYEREFRGQNCWDPHLCGCGVVVMGEEKAQGDPVWTALRRGPCQWNRRMRCLGNQDREESEFSFRNFVFCCWRNVQEKLSSWELKSSECWEGNLYFKVSGAYMIHKWMSAFRETRSTERKSHLRTGPKAHLLLTDGSERKRPQGKQRRSSPQRRVNTWLELAAPW